jgi:hypothetical protein
MEDLISDTEVSVKDLFGKEFKDIDANSDEMTWLKEFNKSDLTKGIDLDDVKVNLKNKTVNISFDDSN